MYNTLYVLAWCKEIELLLQRLSSSLEIAHQDARHNQTQQKRRKNKRSIKPLTRVQSASSNSPSVDLLDCRYFSFLQTLLVYFHVYVAQVTVLLVTSLFSPLQNKMNGMFFLHLDVTCGIRIYPLGLIIPCYEQLLSPKQQGNKPGTSVTTGY